MNYVQLKYYLRWCIKPTSNYSNTQLIIIEKLIQNNGIMVKSDVDYIICSNNNEPDYKRYIYDILKHNDIINLHNESVILLDCDNLNPVQKKILLNICKFNPISKINKEYIKSLYDEFTDWLSNYSEINYDNYLDNNKKIIMETLKYVNTQSYTLDEYQINILLMFDNVEDFLNIKISSNDTKEILELLNHHVQNNYGTDDYELIEKFNMLHLTISNEKSLEIITPLLFFLKEFYPIINKDMNHVYSKLMKILGKSDEILTSQINYQMKIDRWKNLMNDINPNCDSIRLFQIYCYWLTKFIFNNPRSISNNWSMLNFPDYLIHKQSIEIKNPDVTGFVILLDALGTRNKSNSDSSYWQKLISDLRNYFSYPQNNITDKHPILNFSYFSDTILITFEMPDDKFSTDVLNTIGKMLGKFMIKAIHEDIFFRGCISFGDYSVDESGISGKAVNEVGDYHRLPNWIGISVAPSIYMKLIESWNDDIKSFIFYLLPTKNGIEPNFVLNLPYLHNEIEPDPSLLNIFQNKLIQQKLLNSYDSLKYRNTLEFIKFINSS